MRLIALLSLLLSLVLPSVVVAQAIPPPAGPVTFCGTQAAPLPDSFRVAVDGGTPSTLTPDAVKNARCSAASTHSFQLPAGLFPIGQHTVTVQSVNAFGTTVGPSYTITVGVAPGAFTVTDVFVRRDDAAGRPQS